MQAISSTILATAIFLFFLLPGFAFLRRYWASSKGDLQDTNLYIYVIWGTPISLIFYFGVYSIYCVIYAISKVDLLEKNILYEALLHNTPLEQRQALKALAFALVTSVIASVLGHVSRRAVIALGLDVRISFLRFSNDWFYILNGRTVAFKGTKLFTSKSVMTIVDILCVIDDSPVIYTGYVLDFNLKKDGALEYISITDASRRPVNVSNPMIQVPDYSIPGNGFLIKGEEVKSINWRYKITREQPSAEELQKQREEKKLTKKKTENTVTQPDDKAN